MLSEYPRRLKLICATATATIVLLLMLPIISNFNGEIGQDFFIFVGRFHIVVLHFPIGWLLMVPVIIFINKRFHLPGLHSAERVILVLAAGSTVLAAVFGFTLAVTEGYSGQIVIYHMWAGIITCIASILACVFKEHSLIFINRFWKSAYALFLIVALLAITIGGHLGGTLVQGEGYLSEKMPVALKDILGIEHTTKPLPSLNTPIYASIIEPILQNRCMSCHNEKKNKGQFQMHSHQALFKGGKSKKKAVIPGQVEKSEMLRRITLTSDKKQVMPPKNKPPLETSQIDILRWWVSIGAPIEKSINQLSTKQYPEEIAVLVLDLIQYANVNDEQEPINVIERALLEQHVVTLKHRFGIDVAPVSQDLADGLQLKTINMQQAFTEKTWQALMPLAAYIRILDLANTMVNSNALHHIVIFSQLEQLYLAGTKINDTSLKYLVGLSKLRTLNLFNTSISDRAVTHLIKLRGLTALYLYQTQVSAEGYKKIKRALPRCKIVAPSIN